jgi:hypothetical protein
MIVNNVYEANSSLWRVIPTANSVPGVHSFYNVLLHLQPPKVQTDCSSVGKGDSSPHQP